MEDALPTTNTRYQAAVDWIYDRIDYERVKPIRTSKHFRLERIERLLALIDSPQTRIPAIHIAGTKGKGSTAAFLSSILTHSGIRTGLFTSPHIHRFEERMQVDRRMPDCHEMADMVEDLQHRLASSDSSSIGELTYFEVATLLAWMHFDRSDVELAVLETGLGGRLDCTNVCRPMSTIITTIGLDHTHILGNTLAQIAAEKAGIIKNGISVLTWVTQPDAQSVISEVAEQHHCTVYRGDRDITVNQELDNGSGCDSVCITTPVNQHRHIHIPLPGSHQWRNAALAVAAADLLSLDDNRITPASVREGIEQTSWPLRFEVFPGRPDIVLDAAHNPDAVTAFAKTLTERFSASAPRVLLFASSMDKDAEKMLSILSPCFDAIVLTRFVHNPRAIPVSQLSKLLTIAAGSSDVAQIIEAVEPSAALMAARDIAGESGVICVTGSIFLAAEVRAYLLES